MILATIHWADLLLPALGLLITLAVISPFLKASNTKTTIELLRSELSVERDARLEQERRCNREVAELRGELKVLTQEFARTIAKEVVSVMRDM